MFYSNAIYTLYVLCVLGVEFHSELLWQYCFYHHANKVLLNSIVRERVREGEREGERERE